MTQNDNLLPISVNGGHQLGIDTATIRANARDLSAAILKVSKVKEISFAALTSACALPNIHATTALKTALRGLIQAATDLCSQITALQNSLDLAAARYENCEARSRQLFSPLSSLPASASLGLPIALSWWYLNKQLDINASAASKNSQQTEESWLNYFQNARENISGFFLALPSAHLAGLIALAAGSPGVSVTPKIGSSQQKIPVPLSASQLVTQFNQAPAYPDHGELRVVKYRTGNKISWRVDIRGTQVWSVTGTNPQDMRTNLQTNACGLAGKSDMTKAVTRALDQAGYRSGQPVELIGHSQGGAVAAQVGSDPKLAKKYNVKSVVTLGSNTGGFRPAPGVHMVALENTADIVPRLDGRANPNVPNLTTVQTYKNAGGISANHSKELYAQVARAWERSGDGDYARFIEARNYNLGINHTTQATAQSFVVQREASPSSFNPKLYEKVVKRLR